MKLSLYQVDAFTDRVFSGNPAAVVPLDTWPDDSLLQAIAEENNLSETAFFTSEKDGDYKLRWFTPAAEVDLCGHATLATAHVLFHHLHASGPELRFRTRSGLLTVRMNDGGLTMDFPASTATESAAPEALIAGLGAVPTVHLSAFDHIAVFDSEEQIRRLEPDFARLADLDLRGVIATAPGQDADFVSRAFFPKLRVNEDPVTGSSHTELLPYWAQRLGRTRLTAGQLSKRGGSLICELQGDRVRITGQAADYMKAEIHV